MTLDEKIKQLRKTISRLRKYTPVEDFGAEARACRRTMEGYEKLADWLEELQRYKDLEEQGRLLVLPCKVGDTVYEILEETVPNGYFYISEYKVQDVSTRGIKYAGEWEQYDYEDLYFTRAEAEAELERRRDNKMLEIDCRICKNVGKDECKLYGRDPDVAVKKCAENGFKDYRPSRQRKNKKEGKA